MVQLEPESKSIYQLLSEWDKDCDSSTGPRNVFMAKIANDDVAANDDLEEDAVGEDEDHNPRKNNQSADGGAGRVL